MSTTDGDENNAGASGSESPEKIVFLLRAAGGAPILKRKKWAVPRSKTIGYVAEFLRNHLQLDNETSKQLFIYVNQAFAPAFDTTIGAVNDCFNSEGTLVLHYTLTPAWG